MSDDRLRVSKLSGKVDMLQQDLSKPVLVAFVHDDYCAFEFDSYIYLETSII